MFERKIGNVAEPALDNLGVQKRRVGQIDIREGAPIPIGSLRIELEPNDLYRRGSSANLEVSARVCRRSVLAAENCGRRFVTTSTPSLDMVD
jgi:hypothetical protein